MSPMDQGPRPLPAEDAERRRIAYVLSQAGFCLPGSIGDDPSRCGKPGCRCKADPPMLHGPYHHWTRKIDNKTVGRYLSDEQLQRYGGWFEEAKRLRACSPSWRRSRFEWPSVPRNGIPRHRRRVTGLGAVLEVQRPASPGARGSCDPLAPSNSGFNSPLM